MFPRSFLKSIFTASLAIRSRPQYWQFVGLAIVLLVILLASILRVPAFAQPQRDAISDSALLSRVVASGDILFHERYRYRLSENDDRLIQSLASDLPVKRRLTAISFLAERGSIRAVTAALNSSDSSVRIAAIQILGWQNAPNGVPPLIRASFDPDPTIREAAINALGEIGSWLAVPRLQQAQIVEMRYYVQEAAYLSEQRINDRLAEQLGVGASELHAVAVASVTGFAFAVTSQGLYVRRAECWERIDNVPDVMTGVVTTSPDGKLVYLGTISGLYRSADSGTTWESVPSPVPEDPEARITAVLTNPTNPNQVFVALTSSMPAIPVVATPLGIYVSSDRGSHWIHLPDSPHEYLTTRLALDPAAPRYLFGATGVGTWRYTMSESVTNTHSN